eukprot:GEMP01006430.1.p1 GENE.GEMP01006430.1~~GEMP01006430.1.p1  ORF type:complete len:1009 (-),score=192.11 GEMP01006430.1:563-3589(-)
MATRNSRCLIFDKMNLTSPTISINEEVAGSPLNTTPGPSLGSTTPYFRTLHPVLRENAFMINHWGRTPVTDYTFALPVSDTSMGQSNGFSSPSSTRRTSHTVTPSQRSYIGSNPSGRGRISCAMNSPVTNTLSVNFPGSPRTRDVNEKGSLDAPSSRPSRPSVISISSPRTEPRPLRASRRVAHLAEAHELTVFEARVVNGSASEGKVAATAKAEWEELLLRTGESGSVSDLVRRLMEKGELDVLMSMYYAFDRVGCYFLAEQVMRRRLESCQRESATEHAENTLMSLHLIGLALQQQKLHIHAESFLADAFAGYHASLGPNHADTLSVSVHLGVHFREVNSLSEARETLSSAYMGATAALGADHPVSLEALREYAILLVDMKCIAEAEALIPNMERHAQALGADHPDTIAAASVRYSLLTKQDEAEKSYRALIATATPVLGSLHPKVLKLRRQLALALHDSPEAGQLMEQLIVDWGKTVGQAHRRVYHASHDAGVFYASSDDLLKAETHFRSAYDGFRLLDGPNDYFTVLCCSKYSSTLLRLKKLDDCEQMMRKVHASVLAKLGNNHVDTYKALNNVAIVSEKRFHWREAEQLFRDASAGWTRCAGLDEANVIESLIGVQNLAYFLQVSRTKFVESEKLFRRCLQGWERALGEEHPNTLLALNNVGTVLRDQRRMQECEPILLKVLKLREKVLGPDDPDTLEAYHNMAVCAKISRRSDDATNYHQHAWDSRVRVLGDKHLDTISTVYHVGLLHLANDMYYDGIDLFEECAKDAEDILGSCHPFTLNIYNALANAFTYIGKDRTAEKYFCKAISGLEKIYGNTHPDTLRLARNMATMYKRLKQFEVSEGYWRRALDGWVEYQGPDHPETLWTACQLALVLEIQFKDDQAAKYYKWAKTGRDKFAQTDMSTLDPQSFDVLTDVEKLTRDRAMSDPLITNPYVLWIVQFIAKYFTSHVYKFLEHVMLMIRKRRLFWPTSGPQDDSSEDNDDQDDSGYEGDQKDDETKLLC